MSIKYLDSFISAAQCLSHLFKTQGVWGAKQGELNAISAISSLYSCINSLKSTGLLCCCCYYPPGCPIILMSHVKTNFFFCLDSIQSSLFSSSFITEAVTCSPDKGLLGISVSIVAHVKSKQNSIQSE